MHSSSTVFGFEFLLGSLLSEELKHLELVFIAEEGERIRRTESIDTLSISSVPKIRVIFPYRHSIEHVKCGEKLRKEAESIHTLVVFVVVPHTSAKLK
ncbi:hypothetical protein AAC387_Pa08g2269 [Persea americana]